MLCTGSRFLLIVATARLVSGLIVLTDQWLSPFLGTNTHNVLHFLKTVVSVTNKGEKKIIHHIVTAHLINTVPCYS